MSYHYRLICHLVSLLLNGFVCKLSEKSVRCTLMWVSLDLHFKIQFSKLLYDKQKCHNREAEKNKWHLIFLNVRRLHKTTARAPGAVILDWHTTAPLSANSDRTLTSQWKPRARTSSSSLLFYCTWATVCPGSSLFTGLHALTVGNHARER